MVVVFYSDEPERFCKGTRLKLGDRDVIIEQARPIKDGVILAFEGVTDRNEAETLKGSKLFLAKADRRRLGDDEYWPEDLIGLEAFDGDGNHLGSVSDVALDAAQARLVISTVDGRTVEVPFVDELVPDVDVDGGQVVLRPIRGLLDD